MKLQCGALIQYFILHLFFRFWFLVKVNTDAFYVSVLDQQYLLH
jgi:hypothetical protein